MIKYGNYYYIYVGLVWLDHQMKAEAITVALLFLSHLSNIRKMQKEIWRDVPGYENLYKVSNMGNVKSISRVVVNNKGFRVIPTKILNPGIDSVGYYRLNLSVNSNIKTYRVHVLVAMAFLRYKTIYGKIVCDHKDENKLNNNLSNLQIISLGDNIRKNRFLKRIKTISL